MKKKLIFFDVDGTLLSTKDGRPFCIPPSALQALEKLRQNGHRIAICSGRPEVFIHRYFPGLFQTYVALNGAHVVFDGTTVLTREFSTERVKTLMRHFDSYGCRYTFVGKDHAWGRNISERYPKWLNEAYGIPDYLVMDWRPENVHASMMDFLFRDEEEYHRCRPAFDDTMVLNYHPGNRAADLSFRGEDKAGGIRALLEYSGIDRSDTIAFGDGYNDISMMETVGFGVAMGNAVEEVKQRAGYVTSSVFEDGIYHALEHLGLIAE
ncbi:HAD family hydrolase [Caproiciproducens sp. LBM24188]